MEGDSMGQARMSLCSEHVRLAQLRGHVAEGDVAGIPQNGHVVADMMLPCDQ